MDIICTVNSVTVEQVRQSRLFSDWASRVQNWNVPRVTVVDEFSWENKNTRQVEIQMLLMRVSYGPYDHAILLRGSTVDVLTILHCQGRTYVVHVDQPRVAVGQIVRSNPAGMVDGGELNTTAAMRELSEELDIELEWGEPINLNERVYGVDVPELGSPGGTDEDVTYFVVNAEVSPEDLRKLNNRRGGLAEEGEGTVVKLTYFQGRAATILPSLTIHGRPDKKASHSILMYDWMMELERQKQAE